MIALTQRTDVLKRQDKKRTDHDHLQQQPGMMRKGQRKILSGRSSWMGFCYNKGAPVRWNRSAQVIEGMRWNHYRSCGKDTPSLSMREHERPPIVNGAMKCIESGKKNRTLELSSTVEEARHTGVPRIEHQDGSHRNIPDAPQSLNPCPESERAVPCGMNPHGVSGNDHAAHNPGLAPQRLPEAQPGVPGYIAQNPNAAAVQIDCDEPAPQRPSDIRPIAQVQPNAPIISRTGTIHAQVRQLMAQIAPDIPIAPKLIESDIPAHQDMMAPPILEARDVGAMAQVGLHQVKTVSALPMHEGPMPSDPIANHDGTHPRSHGYIGSFRKRGIALKTTNASADPE